MAALVHLDTHVLVWLAAERQRIPKRAMAMLRKAQSIAISPIVMLELQFLCEIGRLRLPPAALLEHLRRALPLQLCEQPFVQVVELAQGMQWTRDPFDRLIAAQSTLAAAPLLSADQRILQHHAHALWD